MALIESKTLRSALFAGAAALPDLGVGQESPQHTLIRDVMLR